MPFSVVYRANPLVRLFIKVFIEIGSYTTGPCDLNCYAGTDLGPDPKILENRKH